MINISVTIKTSFLSNLAASLSIVCLFFIGAMASSYQTLQLTDSASTVEARTLWISEETSQFIAQITTKYLNALKME